MSRSHLSCRNPAVVVSSLLLAACIANTPGAFAAPPKHLPTTNNADNGYQIGYDQRPEVRQFIERMVDKHQFSREELTKVFALARYNESVARLINPLSTPKPKVWADYRARFLDPQRIAAGVQFWRAHADDLARATQLYGVPSDVIVGILGIETIYGRNVGNYRVLDALTTLAFDYPDKVHDRSSFFLDQLEDYLVLARDNGNDLLAQRGSYAGAIGMPQFMPSSFIYAVDFDGDGVIDLTGSASDAIGSVANFLSQQGWERDAPVMTIAVLEPNPASAIVIDALLAAGPEPTLEPSQLRDAGLVFDMPMESTAKVALIDLPEGDAAPDYAVGYRNFFVLTRYNRSYFYAAAVLAVGRAVREQLNLVPSPVLTPSATLSPAPN
jgi:membrane-bound lytic murein transglycosylase B